MSELMIALGVIYIIFSFIYFVATAIFDSYHFFNPIINYYHYWKKLNALGVFVFTLLLNVIFAPWAIIYWVIKFFMFIFTVGR